MLKSNGRCEHCDGVVRNIEGRRHSVERLTEIHNQTCPGLPAPRKKSEEP